MDTTATSVRKFLYSHYFSGGVRQAVGVLTPPFVFIGGLHLPTIGVAAAFGALCVSIIDQPGPHQHRLLSMLGCVVLGTLTALLTGLATAFNPLLIVTVVCLTFFFGLFSALGRKASLVGFGCLLLMTLTMHTPLTPQEALVHAAATLGGGLWYTLFSVVVGRLQPLKQEKQALAVALFALAEFIAARSEFYDVTRDLEDAYRALVPKQSALAEKVQAARDLILRILPGSSPSAADYERVKLGNIFVDMVDLQDTMLATYTDYTVLREAIPDSDFLLFAGQALRQVARDIDRIGLAIIEDRIPRRSTQIKAQLRAMEYETVLMKNCGFPAESPQAWIVIVQVLRRLRTAARLLARMDMHARMPQTNSAPELLLRADKSLRRFVSREDISVKRLLSHLTLGSAHFRYAVRLSLAVGVGLAVASLLAWIATRVGTELGRQGYWIVLTILVIMKPGFALSWQRNRRRLAGTLIGCAIVAALLAGTDLPLVLLSVMLIASILSNSLVQINYMASSVLNTMFVLLAFHFLSPGSLLLIGERAFDALLGSLIVFGCSFVLPSWESRSIGTIARAAIAANRRFLQAAANPPDPPRASPATRDDVAWRLARRDAQASFANFADAYYRMMREPKSQRIAVSKLNDLLVQTNMLTAQISTLSPLMTVVGPAEQQPENLRRLFAEWDADLHLVETLLAEPLTRQLPGLEAPPPQSRATTETLSSIARALSETIESRQSEIEIDETGLPAFEIAHLTHQLRQIGRTIQRIGDDAVAVREQARAPDELNPAAPPTRTVIPQS